MVLLHFGSLLYESALATASRFWTIPYQVAAIVTLWAWSLVIPRTPMCLTFDRALLQFAAQG